MKYLIDIERDTCYRDWDFFASFSTKTLFKKILEETLEEHDAMRIYDLLEFRSSNMLLAHFIAKALGLPRRQEHSCRFWGEVNVDDNYYPKFAKALHDVGDFFCHPNLLPGENRNDNSPKFHRPPRWLSETIALTFAPETSREVVSTFIKTTVAPLFELIKATQKRLLTENEAVTRAGQAWLAAISTNLPGPIEHEPAQHDATPKDNVQEVPHYTPAEHVVDGQSGEQVQPSALGHLDVFEAVDDDQSQEPIQPSTLGYLHAILKKAAHFVAQDAEKLGADLANSIPYEVGFYDPSDLFGESTDCKAGVILIRPIPKNPFENLGPSESGVIENNSREEMPETTEVNEVPQEDTKADIRVADNPSSRPQPQHQSVVIAHGSNTQRSVRFMNGQGSRSSEQYMSAAFQPCDQASQPWAHRDQSASEWEGTYAYNNGIDQTYAGGMSWSEHTPSNTAGRGANWGRRRYDDRRRNRSGQTERRLDLSWRSRPGDQQSSGW